MSLAVTTWSLGTWFNLIKTWGLRLVNNVNLFILIFLIFGWLHWECRNTTYLLLCPHNLFITSLMNIWDNNNFILTIGFRTWDLIWSKVTHEIVAAMWLSKNKSKKENVTKSPSSCSVFLYKNFKKLVCWKLIIEFQREGRYSPLLLPAPNRCSYITSCNLIDIGKKKKRWKQLFSIISFHGTYRHCPPKLIEKCPVSHLHRKHI